MREAIPVQYSINASLGIVFSSWYGVVTTSEIMNATERLRGDPEFDANFSELIDMSEFRGTNATSAGLGGIIRKGDPYSPSSKHAVVAPGPAAYGIARMYQNLGGDTRNIEVFRSAPDAKNWLGIVASSAT